MNNAVDVTSSIGFAISEASPQGLRRRLKIFLVTSCIFVLTACTHIPLWDSAIAPTNPPEVPPLTQSVAAPCVNCADKLTPSADGTQPAIAVAPPEPASLATAPSYPASASVAIAQPEFVPVATRVTQPTNSGDANQNSKPGERTLENSNANATPSLIPPSKGSSSVTPFFYVSIGAFAIAENASKAYKTVSEANIVVFTQDVETPKGKLTRVRAGPYTTRALADAVAKKIGLLGLDAVIVRE